MEDPSNENAKPRILSVLKIRLFRNLNGEDSKPGYESPLPLPKPRELREPYEGGDRQQQQRYQPRGRGGPFRRRGGRGGRRY